MTMAGWTFTEFDTIFGEMNVSDELLHDDGENQSKNAPRIDEQSHKRRYDAADPRDPRRNDVHDSRDKAECSSIRNTDEMKTDAARKAKRKH